MKDFFKSIYNWLGTDGLLHFLVCYTLMLTFSPLVGVWWALAITAFAALAKETWDVFVEKDNNAQQALHDLICDGVGIAVSVVMMVVL